MNLALLPAWLRPPVPQYEGSVRERKWDSDGTVSYSRKGRTVVIDGVRYPSINAAAKALRVPYTTIQRRCK